ncbi:MAG: carbamate kinase, partial [Actinomycetota bacterium]
GADLLVFATDVDAVYTGFGTQRQRAIASATPLGLRQLEFAAGSMAPKVEAACRFVERLGGRADIGSLAQLQHLLEGTAGTQVRAEGPELQFAPHHVPVGGRS